MRFLQQQIRLCSSGSARPQHKFCEDGETVKIIQIPPSAYDTKSHLVTHDADNGNLFKVCQQILIIGIVFISSSPNWYPNFPSVRIVFRFIRSTRCTGTTSTETRSRYACIWKTLHRSHVKNILAQKSWRLAKTGNNAYGKLSNSSRRQSSSLRCRGEYF